jgi:hypothetical protein
MSNGTTSAGRRLHFEIFRFNPLEPETKPYMQSFEIEEKPYMSLFMALNEIRETLDPSLQFDFACRSAICGSCGMMVNGRPALGCRTLTSDLPETIHLHPLPVFKLIGDLSVDTGTWFRAMVEKTEGWIHTAEAFDPEAEEARLRRCQCQRRVPRACWHEPHCTFRDGPARQSRRCRLVRSHIRPGRRLRLLRLDGLRRRLPEGAALARGECLPATQGIYFGIY